MAEHQRPRLCVLERFQLLVGDHPIHLPVQAQRLLVLLAVHGPAQARSTLASTLWCDVPERRAQANLRNAVWRIRLASDAVLRCTRGTAGLDATLAVDLQEAQRCAAALIRGDAPDLDEHSADALGQDLLPSWDEDWLVFEQEQQRQLRIHALEALSTSLCRQGRYLEAISSALAAVRAEPLRESAQRTLISAHLGEGNVSEAIRQYNVYQRLLDLELGLAPSEQLASLVYPGRGAYLAVGAQCTW